MKLEDLNLPVRAYNILKRAGVNDTEALTVYTKEQIAQFRCSNAEVAAAVETALREVGLSLSSVPKTDFIPRPPVEEPLVLQDGDRTCFVERYLEPLQSALKARGLFNVVDFASVTKSYVSAIPGVTPPVLRDISMALEVAGVEFATPGKVD